MEINIEAALLELIIYSKSVIAALSEEVRMKPSLKTLIIGLNEAADKAKELLKELPE